MIQLKEQHPAKARLARSEIPVGNFIPYACHYDDQTILTKNGHLIQFLCLDGFAFESADQEEIDIRRRLRNVFFKSLAGPEYALWFHIIRSRQSAYPGGRFEPGFAYQLNERWKERNEGRRLFQNSLYLSIVKRVAGSRAAGFGQFWKTLSHKGSDAAKAASLRAACQDLKDITHRLESTLSDYGPRILTTHATAAGAISEPLAFLARLINLEERPVLVPVMDLSRYLAWKRLFFGGNAIECRGSTRSRLAAMVSIKEYAPETSAGLLDGFFSLPFEFVLTQSFTFVHRQEALSAIQLQQRRMEQTGDLAVSQTDEIDQALDEATAGAIAFGRHHLTVQPIVNDLKELDEGLARIDTELMNLGILGVREDLNMEPCFWAQLPGNFEYIARRATVSTANLAGFASLHNFPTGRPEGNHWGPAVTVLETKSGTPYFFNFHAGDVGHTTLIGPTGCGKTALMNFLCAQSRKFGCRVFYFDRDRGSEIFLRALGGTYRMLGAAYPSGFNPLQLADTSANRAFLADWLKCLLTAFGEPLTDEELARVGEAVTGNFKLAWDHRTLGNVAPFLGMAGPGSLAGRMAIWHGQGEKQNLFGGSTDLLSLDRKVMAFEMGPLLSDASSIAPVLLYLFHRIRSALDGTPTMIVLEEAWALLKNPIFAAKIEDWLKTFRKMNALVVFATQSVEDAVRSEISPALIGQTATHIYFSNPKATEEYRSVFKLSEREMHLIRDVLDKDSRYFLLKQGRDSVVARADFSPMPDIISVLSGRAETLAIVDRLRSEFGEDPAVWLPLFQKEASHALKD
jgi:type IV secretion system protein VirB4